MKPEHLLARLACDVIEQVDSLGYRLDTHRQQIEGLIELVEMVADAVWDQQGERFCVDMNQNGTCMRYFDPINSHVYDPAQYSHRLYSYFHWQLTAAEVEAA